MDFGWVGVAIVAVIVLSRLLRKKPDPLFPNGPVTMTLGTGAAQRTFTAPDRTVMRVLWKEIYEERCYDTKPLTPVKDMAAAAAKAGRPLTVVDVGGNIGVFARYAAEQAYDAGAAVTVHTFEPIPPMFKLNVANTESLTQYGSSDKTKAVRHHNFGLTRTGGHTDKVTFQYFPGLPGNGTMKEDERAVFHGRLFADADGVKAYIEKLCKEAPALRVLFTLIYPIRAWVVKTWFEKRAAVTVPFDCVLKTAASVIESEGIERIDLLKIDVEGAEMDVMLGLGDSDWAKVGQVVAEVHDHDGRVALVKKLLTAQGFEVTVEQEEMFQLLNQPTFMAYAVRNPAKHAWVDGMGWVAKK